MRRVRLAVDLRAILWLGALAALIVFRGPVFISLLPFVIGLVLANFIEPIVALFEQGARMPRGVAAALAVALLVVVLGYLGTWMVTEITHELIELSRLLPAHQRTAVELFNTFLARGQGIFQELPDDVQALLQETAQNMARSGTELATAAINRMLAAVANVPTVTLIVAIAIVAAFFFAKDRDVVHPALLKALPLRMREVVAEARDKILLDLARFFRAYAILFLISAGLAAVGLLFVDTKYWIVLSLTLAVLDSIPIVGPAFVLLPWAAYALYMGAVRQAVILVILCAVMFVVRQLLQPKLLGDSVGVHPLMMLLALWAGLVTVGFLGVFVGPAVVIAVKAAHNAGLLNRRAEEVDARGDGAPVAAAERVQDAAPTPSPAAKTGEEKAIAGETADAEGAAAESEAAAGREAAAGSGPKPARGAAAAAGE